MSRPQVAIGRVWRPDGLVEDVAAYVCLNAPILCLCRSEIACPDCTPVDGCTKLAERADNLT
jgi:hypothetical protein